MEQKSTDYTEKKDYLDSLADKMEALGLVEESYVNQISKRLEPVLGEKETGDSAEASDKERTRTEAAGEPNKQLIPDRNHKRQANKKQTKGYAFYKDPVVWLLLLLTGVVMSVILKSGFYTDDIILSYQSKYFIWDTGTNVRTYLGVVVQSWLNQGRFFPVSNIYVSLLMHYVNSAFVYKLLIMLFVVLNVYVLGVFIRRLTGSRDFSLLAMAVVPVCLQIRAYHDGLIAYHLLMQVVLLLLLFTAMALQQFLIKKRLVWLLVSLVPYTIGLLTYEVFYISIFLLCFLVFFYEAEGIRKAFSWRNIKRTFLIILPYFLIMAGLFLLALRVKKVYGVSYEGIQAEFSPVKVFITAAKQACAAVPLSYHLLCNDNLGHIFHNNPVAILRKAKLQDFAAAVVLMVLSFQVLKKKWSVQNKLSLLGISLTLLLAPAVLIGVSARYQKELFWGIGHIPVYLEYFGITLLGILIAGWMLWKVKKEKLRRLAAGFCSFMLGFILLVQIQDNRAVIDVMNDVYLYSRELLDESIETGVFSKLEDGDILLVENEPLYLGYPGKEYFSYKTGKHLEVYRMEEFLEQGYPENTTVYILSYEADRYLQKLMLKEAVYESYDEEPCVKSIYAWQKK